MISPAACILCTQDPDFVRRTRAFLRSQIEIRHVSDVARLDPVLHLIALQQPRKAEVVVGVQVGDEDRVDGDQPNRALHLSLRPLPAVE